MGTKPFRSITRKSFFYYSYCFYGLTVPVFPVVVFMFCFFFFAGKPFDELRQQIVPIWTEKPGSNVRQHLD